MKQILITFLLTLSLASFGQGHVEDFKANGWFGDTDILDRAEEFLGFGGSCAKATREEIDYIVPALNKLRLENLNVVGPLPADSLFHDESIKNYDAVVCMYHDQALIPVKMKSFWDAVNITIGLPFVRTSPDHGTGLKIAGKNIAKPDSLISAIILANTISKNRSIL